MEAKRRDMQVLGQGTENAIVSAMASIPAKRANARTMPADLKKPNEVRVVFPPRKSLAGTTISCPHWQVCIVYSPPGAPPKHSRRP